MNRDDLSDSLIHLTKGETFDEAVATFRKIISERRLLGGTGDIRGGYKCVCFSESPIATLSRIFANPQIHNFRYRPFGVIVTKLWLFDMGGRHVIYQPEKEFDLLPDQLKYRHVRHEPNRGIDFTWEREWRIRVDEISLDPNVCTLVVPNRQWEKMLRDEHNERDFQKALRRRWPGRISEFPWHFIALEDLGVKIME